MGDLDARSVNNITSLFAALQMCHENSAKMAGHLVQLGSTLTPKQYTYVMKHSLRPLVKISVPPHLCSPAIMFNTQETKEEISINQCLPRPFHPALAVLPPEHPTRCLAAIIHTVLQRQLFNSKESTSTISEEYQVAPKKMKDLQGSSMIPDRNSPKQKKLNEKLQRLHHQPHQLHHQPHQPHHQPLQPHLNGMNTNQLQK